MDLKYILNSEEEVYQSDSDMSEDRPLKRLRTDENPKLVPLEDFADISDKQLAEIKHQLEVFGFVGIPYAGDSPMVTEKDVKDWVGDLVGDSGKKIATLRGIIKGYGIGQAPFMWRARQWIYPIYARLWGTYDLMCSFDGAQYTVGDARKSRINPRDWLHRDQKPQNKDFMMYQGVLNLTPSLIGGATVVVPKSHKTIFEGEKTIKDWFRIPENIKCEPELCRSGYAQTMWIWDSRLWHANQRPAPGQSRAACYVAFAPNPGNAKHSEKRKKLIGLGATTSHWATKGAKNPPPRFYHCTEDFISPDSMGTTVDYESVKHLPFI